MTAYSGTSVECDIFKHQTSTGHLLAACRIRCDKMKMPEARTLRILMTQTTYVVGLDSLKFSLTEPLAVTYLSKTDINALVTLDHNS